MAVLLREVPNQHCRDPTSHSRPAGDYKLPVMIHWIHADLDTDNTDIQIRQTDDRQRWQKQRHKQIEIEIGLNGKGVSKETQRTQSNYLNV